MRAVQQATLTTPIAEAYGALQRPRKYGFALLCLLLLLLSVLAISVGSYDMSLSKLVRILLVQEEGPERIVVWNIRMPRIVAAVVAGWGLGLSGIATQSLLRNPLASPFTLGISQAAAFGAAFAIVVLGLGGIQESVSSGTQIPPFSFARIYAVTITALLSALLAIGIILLLGKVKRLPPETIILAGVAMSALFTSGTILVQYLATDVQIAAVVFWTFGDVARSSWPELAVLTGITLLTSLYLYNNLWNLNAILSGEETARSLGVPVARLRLLGLFTATLVASLVTAFHGVIAFLGLLAPHVGRRLVGNNHRFLVPYACILGSLLLLGADTLGRVLVSSGSLPVGVLTSFMGAPLFLYLLIRGRRT